VHKISILLLNNPEMGDFHPKVWYFWHYFWWEENISTGSYLGRSDFLLPLSRRHCWRSESV